MCAVGKTVDSIARTLHYKLKDAEWRSPSLVILDDLDLIAKAATSPEQEASGDSAYYARVAEGTLTHFSL